MTTVSRSQTQSAASNACKNNEEQAYEVGTAPVETTAQICRHGLGNINLSMVHVMMKERRYSMLTSDEAKTQDFLSYSPAKHKRRCCKGSSVMKDKTITYHADNCGLITVST